MSRTYDTLIREADVHDGGGAIYGDRIVVLGAVGGRALRRVAQRN